MFGFGFGYYDERAQGKLDEAKKLIDNYIALADTSAGPVTEEVVPFHLVTYAQKQLHDYLKQWNMKPSFRFESVPKRKSKVCYTSVTVSAASKAAFLRDRPGQVAIAQAAAQATADAEAAKGRKKKSEKENKAGGGSAPAAKRARV
ncbi:hypothetical protein ABPG75_012982 [Micractinium tetrahymenae]